MYFGPAYATISKANNFFNFGDRHLIFGRHTLWYIQFFSQNLDQKSKFWIIKFFLNVLKSMPTKFEGSILKNEKALGFWSWKNTFLRKMRLKLQRTMYLGVNSKTEVVITWDVLGIFTFCKNWVKLHTIGYWKTRK